MNRYTVAFKDEGPKCNLMLKIIRGGGDVLLDTDPGGHPPSPPFLDLTLAVDVYMHQRRVDMPSVHLHS